MKRVLVYFTIICLSIIPGCTLRSSENEDYTLIYDDLTPYNFEFVISTENNSFSKDEKGILLKLDLISNEDEKIKLELSGFYLSTIEITVPNGSSYILFNRKEDYLGDYEKLNIGDNISYKVDLTLYYYELISDKFKMYELDWSKVGNYSCEASAYGISSNKCCFQIR